MRWPIINPRKLNKRIEIFSNGEISDGAGGFIAEPVLITKTWANVQPLHGREFWQAQQTQAQVTHKVTIRFTDKVNRSHIVSYKNKTYDIQYIININEQNKFLELHVQERQ